MTLGENINALRKKRNLSQEQLGEQIGVTRQTVSNWELDENSPNAEQLKLLSKVLNISIDELLGNDIYAPLAEKVSVTEKRTGIVIKTLKVVGIVLAVQLLVALAGLIVFSLVLKGLVNGGSAPFDGLQYSGTFAPAMFNALRGILLF